MCSDTELLQRYADDRDERAFADLVERHLPLVYAAALRRTGGRSAIAEDVTQQVFSDLARKSQALVRHSSLIAWLYRSARYATIDALRAERRRAALAERAGDVPGASDAEPHVDWERLRPLLDTAMDELKAPDREVVLMRYFCGLPFAEIAARLGLTENAARMRSERSLGKLRERLARRGVRSSAAALAVALGHEACASAPAGVSLAVTQAALAVGPAHGAGAALMTLLMAKYTIPVLSGLVAAGLTAVVWTASSERVSAEELVALRAERDRLQPAEVGSGASTMAETSPAETAAPTSVAAPAPIEPGHPLTAATSGSSADEATRAPEVSARGHSDHGTATPEDAAMTFAWACDIADPVELARMITFDADGRAAALEEFAAMPEEIRAQFATPEALYGMLLAASCMEAPPPGADIMRQYMTMVELEPDRYASRKKDSDHNVHEYQRTGSGWKYIVPVDGVRGLPGILQSDTLSRLSARTRAP